MARPRRRNSPPRDPPLTASRPALLVKGSDAAFRGLIHDLIAYGHRLDACRDAFAAIAGISGAQYEILMLVSRAEGLAVGEVAARLHCTGAFVTVESSRLVERGILAKASDPADGRKVLLKVDAVGSALLKRLAPYQVRVNDTLFERLDAKRFRDLRALTAELLDSGDRAVAMLELLMHEVKREKAAA